MQGTATSYDAVGPLGEDGKWKVTPGTKAPYKTRIIVRVPEDPKKFNGTVFVEWLNVTVGPRRRSRLRVRRAGDAARRLRVRGRDRAEGRHRRRLRDPDPRLPPEGARSRTRRATSRCTIPATSTPTTSSRRPRRRSSTRTARARSARCARSTSSPAGESQSASRLVTYVNAIAPLTNIYDGFMIHSRGGWGAALERTGRRGARRPRTSAPICACR